MSEATNPQDPHELGSTLRRVGHDLRGLLGVLNLEAFSLRELSVDVHEALENGDVRVALTALAELGEIAASLAETSERGVALADEVHGLGVGLQEPPSGEPGSRVEPNRR